MGGRRAKLNVQTKEEPKEDEDEAFVTFSVALLSYFLFPVPFPFFFFSSIDFLSFRCSLFVCFFLFDVRLMHTDSVKFTHYFLTMLSLSFGESWFADVTCWQGAEPLDKSPPKLPEPHPVDEGEPSKDEADKLSDA